MINQTDELKVTQATFQDLLAADPLERFRADDLIFHWVAEQEQENALDLLDVLTVAELKPSPEVFLRALVAYWADLSSELFYERMAAFGHKLDPHSELPGWRHAHLNEYNLRPHKKRIVNVIRGSGTWEVVKRLGIHGACLEAQLLACLEHPEPIVSDAAEVALGKVENLGHRSFDQFLRYADQKGRNGMIGNRAIALARHVTSAARFSALTANFRPGVEPKVIEARCAVVCELDRKLATQAQEVFRALIPLPWGDEQRGLLVRTFTRISKKYGFQSRDQMFVRGLVEDGARTRDAALGFLAASDAAVNEAVLSQAASRADPEELSTICQGLGSSIDIPDTLLRRVVSATLGNYDLHDGLPHDDAVALILERPELAVRAQREIVDWWEAATDGELEHDEIEDAVKLCDALGEQRGVSMLSAFKRALSWFEGEDDAELLPELGQPGAVEVIVGKMQESMLVSGIEPEVAELETAHSSAALQAIADNLVDIQEEIDEAQDAWQEEFIQLWPEADLDLAVEATDEEDEEETYTDDLAVALKALIARLERVLPSTS